MKEKIEIALQNLVGLQLTKTTRAADMECIQFGHKKRIDRKGNLIEIGEFGIHLQCCSWRFIDEANILVGNQDLYEPEDENAEYDEEFDWQKSNLRDKKLRRLIAENILIIESIQADKYGGVEIVFSNKIKLQIFPSYSKIDDYSEYWRLLDNRLDKQIGISGTGVDESE